MRTNNFNFFVLDIETSAENAGTDSVRVWLSYGVLRLYNAFSGVVEKTVRFRTWKELKAFLARHSRQYSERVTYCYSHNLGYDGDYVMKNVGKASKFIANSTHNLLSFYLEEFHNIEFRDSCALAQLPLREVGKIVGLEKLESDYRTIYDTDEVTEEEWLYCERDCDIVGRYICGYVSEYGLLSKMPLTRTGRVRKRLEEWIKHDEEVWDIGPTEKELDFFCQAYRAGVVLSNPEYTGRVLRDCVYADDRVSAYPFEAAMQRFPRSMHFVKKKIKDLDNCGYEFWMARVRLKNFQTRYSWAWWNGYKCEYDNATAEVFGGKIRYAEEIEFVVCNCDWEALKLTYDWDEMEVLEFCADTEKTAKPIPDCIRNLIHEQVAIKSEAKRVFAEKEEKGEVTPLDRLLYSNAKAGPNSIYGLLCEKLARETYEIDNMGVWTVIPGEYKKTKKRLKKNFLFGLYIAAFARLRLIQTIIDTDPFGLVYCDTDSIFRLKKGIVDKGLRISEEEASFDGMEGLGVFEAQNGGEAYKEFITLGAKKYCLRGRDNKLKVTHAGLPPVELESIEEFHIGKVFYNVKLDHRYIYDAETESGGVELYSTNYTISMSNVDQFIVERYNKKK